MGSRKWKWVGLAGCALLALGVGAWWLLMEEPARHDDRTLERIKEERMLRVGLDASYPPFESIDEDSREILGFDVDLAREISQRLGAKVETVNIGFDGLYDALKAGRVDMIVSGLPYDPRLTEDVAYSVAYFNAGQTLVVRAAETMINSPQDLDGRSLAVEWGSTADMEARRLRQERHDLSLKPYPSPRDALVALREGQVDAALVDAVSAYQFIGQEGGVKVVGEPLTEELYVIAVRPRSKSLLAQINNILLQMRQDGTLAKLQQKWLGTQALPL